MEALTGLIFDDYFELLITHPAQKNGSGGRQMFF
jgi:hypothetical protein